MAIHQTEHQKTYERVRDAILAGELTPGERLPQRKLAERFQTTTTTIREVFRTLQSDGLILIEPKWGATVVEITPDPA